MNSQLTEQDQQRFNKQLQDPTDEIGVRSDEEEDDEESDEDEYVPFDSLLYWIDKNFEILATMKRMKMTTEWVNHLFEEIRWVRYPFFLSSLLSRSLGNGGDRKGYGGMTDDLSDEEDQMQMGRGADVANMEEEDDEIDPDMNVARGGGGGGDPRQRGRGVDDAKPRRQKKTAQPRPPYDDDENFWAVYF